MSYAEFVDWMAYYELDPFGEERADLRNAMAMALTANVNRDAKKQRKPFSATDFMPKFETQTEPTDWRVMKLKFQQAATANRKRT